MSKNHLYITAASFLLMASSACSNMSPGKSHGPITLGDSSTIVTETDPKYLENYVTDIQTKEAPEKPAEETPAKDTTAATTPSQPATEAPKPVAQAPKGNGLNIEFKELSVFIPNITTKTFGNTKHNGNSAAYALVTGLLNGNQLQISGGTVQKITQRYQTSVVLKNEMGTFVLDALNHMSAWETLKGNGANYNITGLDEKRLQYTSASPANIKSAIQRAARSKRLSRKKEQELMNEVRNIRAVNQKPLEVVLRTVMWQIEGKDNKGKTFRKDIRIDMPV